MNPADTAQLFQLLFAQRQADPTQFLQPDYKQLACTWTKLNAERWAQWIPPPASCSESDLVYEVSACDSGTATMVVTYEWRAPKACRLGIGLPAPVVLSCGYVTAEQASVRASLVLSVFFIFCAGGITVAVLYIRYQRYRFELALAATKGNRDHVQRARIQAELQAQYNRSQTVSHRWRSLAIAELLSNPAIVLFCIGSLFAVSINGLNTGSLGDEVCHARLGIIGTAFSAWQAALFNVAWRLNLMSRKQHILSTQHAIHKRLDVLAYCWFVTQAVLIIVENKVQDIGDRTISTAMITLAGGAGMQLTYCSTPSTWYSVWIMISNGLLAVASAGAALRAIVAFSTQTTAMLSSQGSLRAARRRVQALSVLLTEALLVSTGAAIAVSWSSASFVQNNVRQIQVQQYCSLLGAGVLMTSLCVPSILLKRRNARAGRHQILGAQKLESLNPNARPEVDRANTLATTLADPVCSLLFRQFCEEAHDAEAIHFLLAAQELFALLETASKQLTVNQVLDACTAMQTQYLVDGAPQQVNISFLQRQHAEKAIQEISDKAATLTARARPGYSVAATDDYKATARAAFEPIAKEVYHLVATNNFSRFLRSDALARTAELVLWIDQFTSLSIEEQRAVLTRLQQLHQNAVRPPTLYPLSPVVSRGHHSTFSRSSARVGPSPSAKLLPSRPSQSSAVTMARLVTSPTNAERQQPYTAI